MFGDLNSVQLIGNITNDLIVKYIPSGTAVVNFGLATNRRYKPSDSEEWKDDTTFHNIVLFGNQVEMFSQRAKKGTRIFVGGRLQTRTWQDQEGKTNYKTEVVADRLILLDRYERGKAGTFESNDQGQTRSTPQEKSQPAPKQQNNDAVIDPDDLPF
jgi:single-strand DNA-binding protein